MTCSAGHCHCGRWRIARVGTRNEMVPPCTMGSLKGGKELCEYKYTITHVTNIQKTQGRDLNNQPPYSSPPLYLIAPLRSVKNNMLCIQYHEKVLYQTVSIMLTVQIKHYTGWFKKLCTYVNTYSMKIPVIPTSRIKLWGRISEFFKSPWKARVFVGMYWIYISL